MLQALFLKTFPNACGVVFHVTFMISIHSVGCLNPSAKILMENWFHITLRIFSSVVLLK